jgi:hypothetical protein
MDICVGSVKLLALLATLALILGGVYNIITKKTALRIGPRFIMGKCKEAVYLGWIRVIIGIMGFIMILSSLL